ncbi:MAG: serine hydrolase [Verrucomicrobia bacterium]|nr:serine hydrolase [Verrucomicrobiota bacterium]
MRPLLLFNTLKLFPFPATAGIALSLLIAVSSLGQVPSIAPPRTIPPASAGQTSPQTAPPAAHGTPTLTKEDAEAWFDGFMPYALQRGDVAGAVVDVVQNGQLLLTKGYGFADVAARKPVDPQRTLFRAGSVSKLFTWTAVMQQVERGKLNLDTDVNTYLDFKIPPRNGKPVTLRNLMTHTAGFDETVRALLITDVHNIPSLEQALKHWVPPRVTDAGSTPAYSNYGAALAGYIVQRVSGTPFDEYIEGEIFQPLGMEYASFRQPLPERLQPDMSKGYKLGSGEPQPFEIIPLTPAGALSISGASMAPFMIAHLQNGAFDSKRILQQATAVEMHDTRARGIEPLHQMLLGFYQNDMNGHRVITHAGDTECFHTELNLLPENGVGLFMSVNSQGKQGAAAPIRSMLFKEFMDRYFPRDLAQGSMDANTAKAHAKMMAGRYRLSRRPHTDFLAFLDLLSEVPVVANADGTITVAGLKGANDVPKKWKEISPFVWGNADGDDRIAARVENGRVTRFGYDAYPFMVFEPVPGWLSSAWLLPLLIASLIALVLTALAWPISAMVRRHYGVAYSLSGADARAHRVVRIASVCVAGLMLLWLFVVTEMLSNLDWAGPKMDPWIILLGVLSAIVFTGGAIVAIWNAGQVLTSQRRRLAKFWSVVLAIACLVVLYVALMFHLIGLSANY